MERRISASRILRWVRLITEYGALIIACLLFLGYLPTPSSRIAAGFAFLALAYAWRCDRTLDEHKDKERGDVS